MQSSTCSTVTEQEIVKSLAERFALLTDKRKARGLRYELPPLLVLLVLARLCGANNPIEIAKWIEYRATWLKEALGVSWRRMPHHSTLRRVGHSALELSEFEQLAGHYLAAVCEGRGEVLNLDGKTLRGTIAKAATSGLQLLAMQHSGQNAVVCQTALTDTENEISAAKRLLKMAELKGQIVTGDAIFAQRELSRQVVTQGGDYLWRVKRNQGKLHDHIKNFFLSPAATAKAVDQARSLDKGHGRLEERVLRSSSRGADLLEWPFVAQVCALQSDRFDCRTGKRSVRTFYAITSLPPMDADATRLLHLTRAHWGIENGLHYRRDMTFKEDACRMKSHTAAQVMAVCNNLALGLIRHAGWDNAAEARRFYDAYPAQALQLMLKPPS